jgi:CRP/FNR family transcriptional regulator, cyclic AMP receptor protein
MRLRNGVFVITVERNCPLYNVGEEILVDGGVMRLPAGKSTCLILAHDIFQLVSEGAARDLPGTRIKNQYDCGGCDGRISFAYKQEKAFATVQMKLLAAADRKEKFKDIEQFASLLRGIQIFQPLSNEDLHNLSTLLKLERFARGLPILKKGDVVDHLHVILSGRVAVINKDGVTLAEIGKGAVFGEMSLLSRETATTTIMAVESTEFATLSRKDFQQMQIRFPNLQVFFYKLLMNRITSVSRQQAEELSSGMVGKFSHIPPVELLQMINSNQKTGYLRIEVGTSKGQLLFKEGELVSAVLDGQDGQEAFYRVLALKDGRFKFNQGLSREDMRYEAIGGFMGMLMEGMKRLDDMRS